MTAAPTLVHPPLTPGRGTTADLAAFALDTRFAELPREVVEATQRIIADTIACAVGAIGTDVGRSLIEVRSALGGRPDATLLGSDRLLPVTSAAYVGAHLANVLDADETLLNRSHFASCIVMPALAAAQWRGASGTELVTAVAVGFDIATRIGFSLAQYEVIDGEVRWSTVFGFDWAALGTAAAVARVMGLTREQLENAFGTTLVSAPANFDMRRANGPLFSMPGTQPNWHKYAMYGAIAEAGVGACLLAEAGFLADRTILDTDSNFWMSYGAKGCNRDFILADLGSRWFITETSIKPWPFCRYGHSALDLFSGLLAGHGIRAEEISQIQVTIPPFDVLQAIVTNLPPDDPFKLMMNLPYAYGLVALGVPAGPKWWRESNLSDPRVAEIAGKVVCAIEPSWSWVLAEQVEGDGIWRRIPVAVTVRTARGEWSACADYAKGDPFGDSRFVFTGAELAVKVLEYCSDELGPAAAQRLLDASSRLTEPGAIGELISALSGRPGKP